MNLLASPDLHTQEHAVTALLNLSIHENIIYILVDSGAIVKIVEVLNFGSMELRKQGKMLRLLCIVCRL